MKKIILSKCPLIEYLHFLDECMTSIDVFDCPKLTVDVGKMCLEKFCACFLKSLRLEGIEECVNLKEIEIGFNKSIGIYIYNLRKCVNLENITFYDTELKNINMISEFVNLKYFGLTNNYNLPNVDFLGKCKNLETVILKGCYELEEIANLDECLKLKSIAIKSCPRLENVKKLGGCIQLRIDACNNLHNLKHLVARNLRLIKIIDCHHIISLDFSVKFIDLRNILIANCISLDIDSLYFAPNLVCFYIMCCNYNTSIDLNTFALCTFLEGIYLNHCTIVNVGALNKYKYCANLRYVIISECKSYGAELLLNSKNLCYGRISNCKNAVYSNNMGSACTVMIICASLYVLMGYRFKIINYHSPQNLHNHLP